MKTVLKCLLTGMLVIAAVIITIGSVKIITMSASPEIANQLALMQMNNTADSSFWINAYSQFVNWVSILPVIIVIAWIIPIIIIMVIFRKEITYIIKSLKGESEDEKV